MADRQPSLDPQRSVESVQCLPGPFRTNGGQRLPFCFCFFLYKPPTKATNHATPCNCMQPLIILSVLIAIDATQ